MYERRLADKLEEQGWHVERVAESGARRNSVCDLVGIKDGVSYLIEVKTRSEGIFYTSSFTRDFERLIETARRVKAIPILAILFKRRGWKLINLDKIQDKIEFHQTILSTQSFI